MVAVSIFSLIMVIVGGSIISIFDANRKSQNLRSVMDNLNLTLESMTRSIRFGTNYHCDVTYLSVAWTSPHDCAAGATSIAVTTQTGALVLYRLNGSKIERSIDNGTTYYGVTSADISITNIKFYVFGSDSYTNGDMRQPRVILAVSGSVGGKASSKSTFTLETMVSQRAVDSQ